MNVSSSLPQIPDETLSAYLDGAVSAEEQILIEKALGVDPDLKWRLESLRQTVLLLRALPAVQLKRSYSLESILAAEQSAQSVSGSGASQSVTTSATRGRPLVVAPPPSFWDRVGAFFNSGSMALRNGAMVAAALFLAVLVGGNVFEGNRSAAPMPVIAPMAASAPAAESAAVVAESAGSGAGSDASSDEESMTQLATAVETFVPDAVAKEATAAQSVVASGEAASAVSAVSAAPAATVMQSPDPNALMDMGAFAAAAPAAAPEEAPAEESAESVVSNASSLESENPGADSAAVESAAVESAAVESAEVENAPVESAPAAPPGAGGGGGLPGNGAGGPLPPAADAASEGARPPGPDSTGLDAALGETQGAALMPAPAASARITVESSAPVSDAVALAADAPDAVVASVASAAVDASEGVDAVSASTESASSELTTSAGSDGVIGLADSATVVVAEESVAEESAAAGDAPGAADPESAAESEPTVGEGEDSANSISPAPIGQESVASADLYESVENPAANSAATNSGDENASGVIAAENLSPNSVAESSVATRSTAPMGWLLPLTALLGVATLALALLWLYSRSTAA